METLLRQFLEREATARLKLKPADYDREICVMLDEIARLRSQERAHALLAFTGTVLLHGNPDLVEFRARCIEHLLSSTSTTADAELRRRGHLLLLLAWLQLAALVERGPAAITRSAPLPEGVVLPHGADPEAIADPDLRAQAMEMRKQYDEEVEQYRAKHLALDKQILVATLVRAAARDANEEDKGEFRILAAAMALAPGLPSNVRESLEGLGRES
jgi:hypothetical protein